MSRLTKSLCETFEVKRVRTSPYHPQSDGALERWHACLKGMMKRAEINLKNWDRQLKYLLFAYRDTPHCLTGFSPFTLIVREGCERTIRTVARSTWLESVDEEANVSEWLLNV